MRLSKTAWLILGIGVFIIAFAALFMLYSNESDEQEQLEESLAMAQALLPERIAEKESLESQLAQLESQLNQAESSLSSSKAKFPEAVESIEHDEILFDIAHDCNLEIASLTASEPHDKKVENITYSITLFEVEVRPAAALPEPLTEAYVNNAINNILAFINTVATGEDFTTATVEAVIMEIPELDESEKPSATIKLTIYGYKGE